MPLFPSAYFPSIGYLKLLNKFQDAQIDLHENFVKQSIRNRCEILSANGKLKSFFDGLVILNLILTNNPYI